MDPRIRDGQGGDLEEKQASTETNANPLILIHAVLAAHLVELRSTGMISTLVLTLPQDRPVVIFP